MTGATSRWTVASRPRTDSRHKVERRGPPQRKACSARIGRRRSARRQASVQQDVRASPSFSRRDMGSKATHTTASLSGTDIWRAETRGRQTCGRSTSSRANCSMHCESRASTSVPATSAKTSRRRGSISRRCLSTHSFASALRRTFGSPVCARPAFSSIASSPD